MCGEDQILIFPKAAKWVDPALDLCPHHYTQQQDYEITFSVDVQYNEGTCHLLCWCGSLMHNDALFKIYQALADVSFLAHVIHS